jgi:hypothetical protein
MIHQYWLSAMYNVLWLMSMLMDCSFGHGEFAVDVPKSQADFNSQIEKKSFFIFDE